MNTQEKMSDWLGFPGWSDLELGWDSEYMYKASVSRNVDINTIFNNFGQMRLELLLHPVKYLKSGNTVISVTSGQTITNPTKTTAKPVIELTGTGDMSIFINGKETRFKNVQGKITIDSENRLVYRDVTAEWSRLVRLSNDDFPILKPGANRIVFNGATSVKIKPRWAVGL